VYLPFFSAKLQDEDVVNSTFLSSTQTAVAGVFISQT